MDEPTTFNQYQQVSPLHVPVAEGTEVAIFMTAYAQNSGGTTSTIVNVIAPMTVDLFTRFGIFPYDYYITANDQPGATGDIFTIRTWPAAPGESLPAAAGFTSYQKIILQTSDGYYLAADNTGTYYSSSTENDAAVFLLTASTSSTVPNVILYPAFYTYGDRAQWDPLLSTISAIGSFTAQFVQPQLASPSLDKGPIVLQQVQGRPASSVLAMNVMQEREGVTMPFANGQIKRDNKGVYYLVFDGALRQFPNVTASNRLFNQVSKPPPRISSPVGDNYPVGEPISQDAQLVQYAGKVWLVENGIRRWIISPAVMAQFNFNWAGIQNVTAAQLALSVEGPPIGQALNTMPWPNGTRVHENSTGKIYLVIDDELRHVPNPATYNNLFIDWVINESENVLLATTYNIGLTLTVGAYLAQQAGDPRIWLMVDGQKRHIASPAAMGRFSFDGTKVQQVSAATLNIEQGADIDY